jgi:nucleolar protein 56
MYLYSNIIGTFVFNQNYKIREKVIFTKKDLIRVYPILKENKRLEIEDKLIKKFKNIKNLREEDDEISLQKIQPELELFKDEFNKNNLILTKEQIRQAVSDDLLIIQTIGSINELKKAINLLSKRLREWIGYYIPELPKIINDNYLVAQNISGKERSEILSEFNINDSMGVELNKENVSAIKSLASSVLDLFKQMESKEKYLDKLMKKTCPNLHTVAGSLTGAKLMQIAGGLRNMVMMPASTIQLLGAEKALFMHMTRGSKSPKHGVIVEHPLLSTAKSNERGKRARALADKISMAVKIDFFKGEYIGDKLKKQLEDKFK